MSKTMKSYFHRSIRLCAVCMSSAGITAADEGNAFSGTLDAVVYAMDAAVFAKAPDALLADPAKLLAFLARASKEGKANEVCHPEVKIQNGKGVLSDIKRNIYNTGFLWENGGVVPNQNQQNERNYGLSLEIKATTVKSGEVELVQVFEWLPEFELRPIHGVTRKYGFAQARLIRSNTSATLRTGEPALVADWRSEIPPPGCKPGGQWQYLLFNTLR